MGKYFKDLWLGITSVLAGMQVTFGHLFRKNITIQYPKQKHPMFPRTRADLFNTIEECGACLKCTRICPVGIITVKSVKAGPDEDLGMLPDGNPKKMHVVQFDIDFSKCVYCGLCVDVCDTKSLHWRQPQKESTFSRNELFFDFVKIPHEERQAMIAKDDERKAAAAEARKAKAAAKKKPKPETDDDADSAVKAAGAEDIKSDTAEKAETGEAAG